MFNLFFIISKDCIKQFDLFCEENEINNFSTFENEELGFSNDLDENEFPIANFFNVEIYEDSKEKLENLLQKIKNNFSIKNEKINEIYETNWSKYYLENLKPIKINNFYFYNENFQIQDENLINIKLNSDMAFGTGNHYTTKMCIEQLEKIDNIKNAIDIGCGTGILSICVKKIFKNCEITAIDIDHNAVKITKENFYANNIIGDVILSNENFLKNHKKKYDLVLCNILKNTLIEMHNDINNISTKYLITSGYLETQQNAIIETYCNYRVLNTIIENNWVSHLFIKNNE